MKNAKTVFQIASVYICIILGAGFASGQEILSFFTKYGKYGYLGIIIASILFAIVSWTVLEIVKVFKINNYQEFMQVLMGKKLGIVMASLSIVFLFVSFATMIAASGAVASEGFGLSKNMGLFLMALACFLTFLFDLKGLISINTILAPILIISSIFISAFIYYTDSQAVFLSLKSLTFLGRNFILSAFLYVSYNIISAISVMSEMKDMIDDKKIAKYTGILSGICIFLLAMSIHIPILKHLDIVKDFEIPMLRLVADYGVLIQSLYLVVIVFSIYTTAIAAGFSVLKVLEKYIKIDPFYLKLIFCIFSVFISQLGFSTFVNKAYTIFAYFGLFELIIILAFFFMHRKNNYKDIKRIMK